MHVKKMLIVNDSQNNVWTFESTSDTSWIFVVLWFNTVKLLQLT